MKSLRGTFLGLGLLLGCLLILPSRSVGATSFIVDTTADDPGVTMQDCDGATPTDCSLRGAMTRANLNSGADIITFDTSVFAPGTIPIDSPLPTMTAGGDTIDGTGATVIIDTTRETGDPNALFTCLLVSSAGNTVKGLQITDCSIAISLNLNVSDNNVIALNVLYDNGDALRMTASGASGNSIVGNKIGTTADGSSIHPDGANATGITIFGAGNVIGGTTEADRNIIAGSVAGTGITISTALATGNEVIGNYVGTSGNGLTDLGNGNGIVLNNAVGNTIGGTGPGQGNIISGNDSVNMWLAGASSNNIVAGNLIGPSAAGDGAGFVNGTGVLIHTPSTNNIIGPANVISDNGIGVHMTGSGVTGTQVKGNLIGTNPTGVSGVPNSSDGIRVEGGANGNGIGGATAGDANVIAFNGVHGVRVDTPASLNNGIRGNSMYSNGGKAIELLNGANGELAPPVITAVGSASGTACANCIVDVYSDSADEGRVYYGSAVADDNGDGTGDWSFVGTVQGPNVTATSTNATGNTSEFSVPFACADSDCDGVADGSDNCPSWPNPSQTQPTWPIPTADSDCDGYPDSVGQSLLASETYIGTDPARQCASTSTSNDEPGMDRWPMDFNDNRLANGQDFLTFIYSFAQPVSGPVITVPAMGTFEPERWDFTGNGIINGQDFLKYINFFAKTCTAGGS